MAAEPEAVTPALQGELLPESRPAGVDGVDEAREQALQAVEAARWALTALRYEVRVRTDWRTHFRRNPWVFLGAALVVGILLAGPGRARGRGP